MGMAGASEQIQEARGDAQTRGARPTANLEALVTRNPGKYQLLESDDAAEAAAGAGKLVIRATHGTHGHRTFAFVECLTPGTTLPEELAALRGSTFVHLGWSFVGYSSPGSRVAGSTPPLAQTSGPTGFVSPRRT